MPGNLLGNEYKTKIDGFKDEFKVKMEIFDRSVSLETFKTVSNIGQVVDSIDGKIHGMREFPVFSSNCS